MKILVHGHISLKVYEQDIYIFFLQSSMINFIQIKNWAKNIIFLKHHSLGLSPQNLTLQGVWNSSVLTDSDPLGSRTFKIKFRCIHGSHWKAFEFEYLCEFESKLKNKLDSES
jgi:hypothetical protein